MKSPDEIKKAMLHCSPVSCRSNDCPYRDDTPKYEGDMPVCRMKLWNDMGCLIQQLEAELSDAKNNHQHTIDIAERQKDQIDKLKKVIVRLNAERDAAVADMTSIVGFRCGVCKHYLKDAHKEPCNSCRNIRRGEESNFEWRGVQKEESEDGKE